MIPDDERKPQASSPSLSSLAEMSYHEEHMWSLTSATTCYTGASHATSSSLCFATAHHTVKLDLSLNTISSKDLPAEDHTICIGYSRRNELEAIALLDTRQLQQNHQQQQSPQQQRESGSIMQQSMGTLPDDASTTVASTTQETTASHHRRGATMSSDVSHLGESSTRLSSIASIDSTTGLSESEQPPKAQLILRSSTQEYAVSLDFRPLAPTVCSLGETTGIWLGSADTSKLYWYTPEPETAALVTIPLDHAAFCMESSVMSIDTINKSSESHVLAVACQDGTIRLTTFEYGDSSNSFLNVRETTVIVDGPIVCIHLRKDENRITATAGSLCGYVTELYQQEADWQGPFMVAEGFWNKRLQAEDSVLAVEASGDHVLIGTQAGRCMIYVKQNDGYALQWECQLPHSIHAVCTLSSDPFKFSVTTRRSVHIFSPRESKKRYDANLARERLQALLEKQNAVANRLVEP